MMLDLYSSFEFFISATFGGGGLAMVLGTDVRLESKLNIKHIHIHSIAKTVKESRWKMNLRGYLYGS